MPQYDPTTNSSNFNLVFHLLVDNAESGDNMDGIFSTEPDNTALSDTKNTEHPGAEQFVRIQRQRSYL